MPPLGIDHTITIATAPARVFDAFFDPDWLGRWWGVQHAIVAKRMLAPFALAWATTAHRDAVLGPLGGIFHGLVVDLSPPVEAFIAECYWLPPEGEAIGPMALTIRCGAEGTGCRLRVEQSGYEGSPRWRRYYEIAGPGLKSSLLQLKALLEEETATT
jgi:hypothetical protein